MVSNHMVRFRVTRDQLERIRFDALDNGHLNISSYVRSVVLKDDPADLEVAVGGIAIDVKKIKEAVCNGR